MDTSRGPKGRRPRGPQDNLQGPKGASKTACGASETPGTVQEATKRLRRSPDAPKRSAHPRQAPRDGNNALKRTAGEDPKERAREPHDDGATVRSFWRDSFARSSPSSSSRSPFQYSATSGQVISHKPVYNRPDRARWDHENRPDQTRQLTIRPRQRGERPEHNRPGENEPPRCPRACPWSQLRRITGNQSLLSLRPKTPMCKDHNETHCVVAIRWSL